MLVRRPPYYQKFCCAASDCPDTCCAAWDIVIDEDSLAFYQTVAGELGARIRAAVTVDEDGDHCFSVAGQCCPLLTEDRLCSIQLQLGEEHVCQVCRSHPRFLEEYGTFREESLAASCPVAAELMLTDPSGVPYDTEETAEPPLICEDVDGPLLEVLIPCREQLFDLLRDRSRPLAQRLGRMILLGQGWQLALEEGDLAGMTEMSADRVPAPKAEELSLLGKAGGIVPRQTLLEHLLKALEALEILEPGWRRRLGQAARLLDKQREAEAYDRLCTEFDAHLAARELEYENFARYLTYRWFLKADFDDDLYGKVMLPVVGYLTVRELGMAQWLAQDRQFSVADQADLVHSWCKEIEHCTENIAVLTTLVYDDPKLTAAQLLSVL